MAEAVGQPLVEVLAVGLDRKLTIEVDEEEAPAP